MLRAQRANVQLHVNTMSQKSYTFSLFRISFRISLKNIEKTMALVSTSKREFYLEYI